MTASPSLDTVFLAAIELDAPTDRAAYIARACGDDAALRRRAEELVAAHFRAGSFLNAAAPELAATVDQPPVAERPGTVIGPYKLLEQIGEGGFGVVFMAEQTAAGPPQGRAEGHQAGHGHAAGRRPLRGRAAGPGAHGPSEHRPGLRRRRDRRRAGPTSSWSWSAACPITEYCDQNRLTVRERLELFVARLPGRAARPPEGHHPPRPQAVATSWSRCTTARRCPR